MSTPLMALDFAKIAATVLIIAGTAVVPVSAGPTKASTAKAPLSKSAADKTPPAKPAPVKKEASFSDPPVGAKSQEALLKKFEEAYKNKDGGAYISVLKAPFRQRVQMELQFQRECRSPVNNFKLTSVEQEIYRVKMPSANIGKARMIDGKQEDYDLPVVAFINYDVHTNVQAAPDVIGMAVGEDKATHTFFIVTRHPVVPNKAATTTPAAAAAKPH